MGFLLSHILTYMQDYGWEVPSEVAWVRVIMLAMEGAAARRMVTLNNAEVPELQNFTRFMAALRQWLEEPLADRKARDCIKTGKAAGPWLNTLRSFGT